MTWTDVRTVFFGSTKGAWWYEVDPNEMHAVVFQDGVVFYWEEKTTAISLELWEDLSNVPFPDRNELPLEASLGPFLVKILEVDLPGRMVIVELIGFDIWAKSLRRA